MLDKRARVGDGVIGQNVVFERAASAGGDVEKLLVRRQGDPVRKHARRILVAAEKCDGAVLDQKESAVRQLARRILSRRLEPPYAVGEVDRPVGLDDDVVGAVEALPS